MWQFLDLKLTAFLTTGILRYLGIYMEISFNFKSSYSANKAGFFYKAFNAIFGKVGRSAPEEVLFALLNLLNSKCLPIL